MNQKLKFFLIFVVIIILAYFLAPYVGSLYEDITGYRVPGGWIGSCPECWEGFTIIFAFLSGLLFFGLFDKNRFKIALFFVLVFPVVLILARIGEASLLSLGAGIIGLAIGQLIYLICNHKKAKK
ncbi:MAG: hypothetical protein ABIA91_03760 [Patescibacteria group bacterium]